MKVVGLAGRAGCGKSTIARFLAQRAGIEWIDLDEVAWTTYAPGTDVYHNLRDVFGDEIVDADGGIDRAKLAEAAFANCATVKLLNALVHPAVGRASQELFAEHRARGTEILLVEGALLASSPYVDRSPYDRILWLEAAEDVRNDRLRAMGREIHATRGCNLFPSGDVDIVSADGPIEEVASDILSLIAPGSA